ncbi:MAG: AAA family ATPase [Deltaproteobacteria bacterium]|nr:AAA family ATPase [Deltaproteobacteria bacterium]
MSNVLELPLIGLWEDCILPGETRALAAPVVDPATLRELPARVGTRLCALTVASAIELPTLVTARWGTECTVLAADGSAVTLRGERRLQITRAHGERPPFVAEVQPAADPPEDVTGLVDAGHRLFAALAAGVLPQRPDWPQRLVPALAELVRALATTEELRETARWPLPEAVRNYAQTLAARAQGEHASCALEQSLRELCGKPDIPKTLRQRLWAQTVEISRRLDIYDPSAGNDEDDLGRLQRRLQQAGLPKEARELAKRELRLLRGMETKHHDYPSYRGHLDFLARLAWHAETLPPPDLSHVAAVLDREHAHLSKPKQRILEHLAVHTLGGRARSTILCLVGPPGVGKTTLARAMAEALGRKFVRVALGGVHDESELRGHRLTYVAAAPGRIMAGLAAAGSCAPVLLLDEIDKIGTERARSPIGALHEVLDPEQNPHFVDNYVGVPFDLTHVLFVCTANDLAEVHPTLVDRMETVELEGYLAGEKVEIARKHLLPRLQADCGLPSALEMDADALLQVIEGHTREAGVRQLRRHLEAVHRGRALARVRGSPQDTLRPITAQEVRAVLGPARYRQRTAAEALPVGVATGLSVGSDGGALVYVEAAIIHGKGELRMTGRVGAVMQESAQAALAHLRMDPARYAIDPGRLGGDIHLHVPEAAMPKDGPSAGTAIFAALLSAATRRPLRPDVALTGEITLNGEVLPVGGVRAKLLAAERAGIRAVLLPADNAADIPEPLRVEVVLVRRVAQVAERVLVDPPKAQQPDATAGQPGPPEVTG